MAMSSERNPEDQPPERHASGNYVYYLDSDELAVIDDYIGDEEIVEIPEAIDGHLVIAIGSRAFEYDRMESLWGNRHSVMLFFRRRSPSWPVRYWEKDPLNTVKD